MFILSVSAQLIQFSLEYQTVKNFQNPSISSLIFTSFSLSTVQQIPPGGGGEGI